MAKSENDEPTIKVSVTLAPQAVACLDRLAAYGVYGGKRATVAQYLVQRGLDELLREGILPKLPQQGND